MPSAKNNPIMLSVFKLNVVMLSVMVPEQVKKNWHLRAHCLHCFEGIAFATEINKLNFFNAKK